ncbi:MAG: cadherin-like beta sandwich domain-containing protein [Verrucomicrobiaceae bacterium]|nr:cadherin-like beta sandwich domain-containing protein [Verrucomicrobiaceae bacterium]
MTTPLSQRLLRASNCSLLARLCLLFTSLSLVAHAASISGSYTGNGSSQNITTVGFQPDIVIIKDEIAPAAGTSAGMQIRTSTMSFTKHFGQTAAGSTSTNRITGFLSNGFSVGSDSTVNATGIKYNYLAIKTVSGESTVGTYSGDSVDNRTISGLGFQPDFVMTMDSNGTSSGWTTNLMPADTTFTWDFSPFANGIQALSAGGFELGNDAKVNTTGNTYHYIALKNVAGKFKTGSYVGTGANQSFTGMGFRPEALFVKRDSTTNGNLRFASTGASTTADVTLQPNSSTYAVNAILSLDNDGFSIGTAGNRINGTTPPNTYHYIAFANVAAAAAPVVTSVTSSTANGAYNAPAPISIQVTFDASVTVTGNPTLALNSGGSATYASGSPGTTLTFNYTVGAGQTAADLDYSATNSLALAGGTINATTGGTAATLTLPTPGAAGSLGANKAIVIDTTAPTIGIGSPSQSSIVAGSGSVTYTVTYADTNFNASTLANGNITLNTTGTASGTVGVSGSGLTRTVTISSITGAGTIGISIASGTASDTAGNVAPAAGPSGTFTVTAPVATVQSLNGTANGPQNGAFISWQVIFDVPVSGLSPSNFTTVPTGLGGSPAVISVNPPGSSPSTTWNISVSTGTGDGTLGVNLVNDTGLSHDVTNVPFTGVVRTIDKTAPTIGIGAPSVSTIAAGAGSVTYTVTYADTNFNASTLANGNITLNTTGTASGTVGVSGSGLTRTVTISSITGAGTLGISIAASTANDMAGNVAPAAGPSGTFTVTAPPSADIPVSLTGGALNLDASGSGGAADTILRVVTGPGGPFLEIYDAGRTVGAPAGGIQVDANTVRIPLASVTGLTLTGSALADRFTFDFTAGDPLPAGGITVAGGLPTTTPGDSLVITGGTFTDGEYGPGSGGSGTVDVDGKVINFTGLEPVDLSGSTFVNYTVTIDPGSTFAGNIITTISAVDAGVNTNFDFGSSGLESIKLGTVSGTLTVNGDNVDNDYFVLQGLGSAMTGAFTLDGLGGDSDVIEINNTAVTVAGVDKAVILRADFVGVGRAASDANTGVLNFKGPLTIEANGDFTVATPLWGAGGVWGASAPAYFPSTAQLIARGNVILRGELNKIAGADATVLLKGTASVTTTVTTTVPPTTGGRIISTSNKANIILNADSDANSLGNVNVGINSTLTSNGGDITIGGGANPATTPAFGLGSGGSALTPGVVLQQCTITSGGGAISIRGNGSAASGGHGIILVSTNSTNASISSGAGNITMVGTGGALTGLHGITQSNSATTSTLISTTTGDISLTGAASLANGDGIRLVGRTSVTSSGTGAIWLTGTGLGTGFGVNLVNPTVANTTTVENTGGNILLIADTMNLDGGAGTESISTGSATAGIVTLRPFTSGRAVELGSGAADSPTLLAIDASTELPNITAGQVNIGSNVAAGTVTVSSVISPSTFTTLGLYSSTGAIFSATSGFTADVTTSGNYEKITVIGTIDITAGAAFTANAAGGYVWNGTDTFTFLDNDGIDAITGTFTGPTLTNFLGSTLTATQSYTTGTGNDFGTGIAVANNANLANLQLKSGSTTHVLTPVFAAGTTSYTLDLPNQTISAQINAAVADSAATLELSINGRPFTTLTSGSFTGAISLNTGGNTFAVRVTAPDMVTQKTYTVTITRAPLPPLVLGQTASAGGGTGGGAIDAPNGDATSSLGKWESIRQGAVMSNSGALAFRGHMEVGSGTPPVTVNDFQGIWKYDTVDTRLKARSGSAAPETGGALFDMLPLNPAISPSGFISFYGSLRMGTGIPEVTAADNQGLWSELGGGTLRLVLREGDNVPGTSVAKTFRSGFAVTSSSANTLAINARLSSGTALLHLDVSAPATVVTVVAEEGQAAPGGGTWVALDGNSSDPRLSPSGGLGFIGWELVGTAHIQGIYSRSGGTPPGTPGVVLDARVGSSAPGTGGATFRAFERPTVFDGGIAFRGFLNQDGDNAGGTRGQGIWYRDGGALAPVIRTGDGNAEVSSIPVGSTVTSVWSPFSNSQSTIAYRVGLSNGVTETRAIMTTSSTSTDIVAMVGDAAPGLPGETFTNFDHPVIGDRDHVAFTASTNAGSYGLWRSHFDSGAFRLVLKVGDSINTSQGVKTIAGISLPGATTDDRKFESVCLDDNGNILVHITFSDGSTSLLLGQ